MTLLTALLFASTKPLMRDFIGLNTHTVQFKPELYAPVTRTVRDYHPVAWDLGDKLSTDAKFPMAENGINWQDLYGGWKKSGYTIDSTAMFESIPPKLWTDMPNQAFRYGEAFGKYFGPSGPNKLVDFVEVGNEPADFTEDEYRTMFENMAKGIRKGDPKMKIATCAVAVGKADKYSKDVACLTGLESLIDIVNVHTYAFAEMWPTWKRSYPEDPNIAYLKQIKGISDWRNQRAPGKPVWVTEFGYDSTTKPNKTTGDFSKWVGNTDEEQAKYIVRSYLAMSAMDVDRAYLYWFNDDDNPQLHGSSGLTRNYVPKPSYYSVAHLLKSLGDYRFDRAIQEKAGGAYAYQYKGKTGRVIVAWNANARATSQDASFEVNGNVTKAESMPLDSKPAHPAKFAQTGKGKVTLNLSGSPTYLWIND